MKSGWPRRLLLLVGGTVAALFVAAAILATTGADRPQDPAPETVEQASSSPRGVTEQKDPPLYRLGVYQGRVSVFPPEGDQPIRITETPEAALPEPDRRSLAEGIYVYSREELAGLLEDYGS